MHTFYRKKDSRQCATFSYKTAQGPCVSKAWISHLWPILNLNRISRSWDIPIVFLLLVCNLCYRVPPIDIILYSVYYSTSIASSQEWWPPYLRSEITPSLAWGVGATPEKRVLFVAIISLQFWGEVHPSIFAVYAHCLPVGVYTCIISCCYAVAK